MDVLQVFSGDVVQCLITFVRIKPLCEGLVLSSWCTVWDDCSNFVSLLLLFFLLFVSLSGSGCAAGERQGMQERMRMVC